MCGPRHHHCSTYSGWVVLLGSGWVWPSQSFMNMQLIPEAHNLEHGSWGDSEITWSEVLIVDGRKLRPRAEGGAQGFFSVASLPPSQSSAAAQASWPSTPCSLSLPALPSSCSGLALVAKPSWAEGNSFKLGLRKPTL